jgi:hypothetical protein
MDGPGGDGMRTAQDYQQRAAECVRLASNSTHPTNKALLLEMALTWVKLAEQAETKESEARLPPPLRLVRVAAGQGA